MVQISIKIQKQHFTTSQIQIKIVTSQEKLEQ